MRKLWWAVTALGAFVGGLLLLYSFVVDSAPQQAAIAAVGIGCAVVPYCLSRAFDEYERPSPRVIRGETRVRCNQCDRIYPAHERSCQFCGANRMDSVPV